ncbi:hypothetical protein LMOh7858_1355 [Listeria monocytogenes str. 4b H7858]|nr:hypothetical protein LMOh7858_1355 [Listeria monocytogenes str. 4b H7858] [Listeria monocytogenes serotype 4b str. H7858]
MTAAATTGPARGPRPTSSTPAIYLYPCWNKSVSYCFISSSLFRNCASFSHFLLVVSRSFSTPLRSSCMHFRKKGSCSDVTWFSFSRITDMESLIRLHLPNLGNQTTFSLTFADEFLELPFRLRENNLDHCIDLEALFFQQ